MNPSVAARRAEVSLRKRADLTSGVGAGVLGGGIALLLAQYLRAYAIPLLLVGVLLHGWGMFDRHRLDRQAGTDTLRWSEALYWVCWVALFALALYILARSVPDR